MKNGIWKELCNSYHFDPGLRWTYRSDGRYIVDAGLVADVDNTLTTRPTLTDKWIEYILDCEGVRPLRPGIGAALEHLSDDPHSVKSVLDVVFLKYLRGVLKRGVHEDACVYAADSVAPPPNTRELLFDMYDRRIATLVLTFGMEDALVPWYWEKVGVPVYALNGTRLIFKDDVLAGYDMGGEYGKVSRARSLLRQLGLGREQTIAMSNDPVVDKMVAAMLGVGLMIWTDDNYERRELAAEGEYAYPGKNVVVLRGVGEDRRKITEYVDKKLRSEFVSEAITPSRVLALNEEFARFEHAIDACRKSGGPYVRAKEVADSCGRVIALGNPFVATITNDVEEKFAKLRMSLYVDNDISEMLSWADGLRDVLKNENPEFQLTREHLNAIRSLASPVSNS